MDELKLDNGISQPHLTPDTFWIPIIQSYLSNKSSLPPYLNLDPTIFAHLCTQFGITIPDNFCHETEKRQLIAELAELRSAEQQDLMSLLSSYCSVSNAYTEQMSIVLSAACMGSQHLWKDLGMPERPLLTQLFGFFYPELRAMNNKNMRWKRFLYRQLCSSGGDYVCRAPSCETCTSFSECFADD